MNKSFKAASLLSFTTISLAASRLLAQQNDGGQGTIYDTCFLGAHTRTWSDTNDHQIVEMASGMNYWDGQQWTPSVASFQISQDTSLATANQIQNKVRLNANLNTNSAVTITTADGLVLNSTPIGIGLYDAASGNFTTIGSITNCLGYLTASNRIVYSNAFVGVCANVVYTLEKGAFHQDVVFTGRVNPAEYGFPPNTTRIQILTEFFNPPQPDKIRRPIRVEKNQATRNGMASPDFMDDTLGFGQCVFGCGRAHAATTSAAWDGAPVGKQFLTITNQGATRTFLIESVEYPSIQKELDLLPDCDGQLASASNKRDLRRSKFLYAVLPVTHPERNTQASFKRGGIEVASAGAPAGFVIDYTAVSGTLSTPTVFQGNVTYFVSGPTYSFGALTFEGGTVIKYPTTNGFIQLNDPITLTTAPYRPAIFTAGDDDSVGDKLDTNAWAGYTGTITTNGYGSPMVWFPFSGMGLSNTRFSHATVAIQVDGAGGNTNLLSNSQIANCIVGLHIGGSGSGPSITLNNCLFANNGTPINDDHISIGSVFQVLHCTVAGGSMSNIATQIAATNSVFANFTIATNPPSGDHNGFYSSTQFGSNQTVLTSSPFVVAGAGNYYLNPTCGFLNAGLTNIDSGVLSDLSNKTVIAPIIYTNLTVTVDTTMNPQAQRDVDTPDLGYHYDPIDYLVDQFAFTNATLTVTNGAVFACYNDFAGIWLQGGGGGIVSVGTPNALNWFTRYSCAQEQSVFLGTNVPSQGLCVSSFHTNGAAPGGIFEFSGFSCPAGGGAQLNNSATANAYYTNLLVKDCQFWNGQNSLQGGAGTTAVYSNNLYSHSSISGSGFTVNSSLAFNNNLVWRTSMVLSASTNGLWTANNNAVDTCTGAIGVFFTNNSHNAYINMTGRMNPTNGTEVITNTMTYQSGPLGIFYQPTNSSFINAGTTNANLLGLYHYTTTTNQVKETNSIVDIGFHYVAVTNGLPFDSDGDGVPDYLEDANGNGSVDSGETNWQDKRDFGLKVLITRPKNNSIIP